MLYTDGLIERRGESLGEGCSSPGTTERRHPAEPGAFCDRILDALLGDTAIEDDIAILVVTLDRS